jgi:hypothetical protein
VVSRSGCLALLAALVLVGACSGDDSALGRAEDAMADLESGALTLELISSTEGQPDVGFTVDGRFQEGDGDLPLIDFAFTERFAGTETVTSIIADGERAWVVIEGQVTELDAEQAGALQLGPGEGFADLGLASWVDDPREASGGGGTTVTGSVDVVDLVADLARLLSELAGGLRAPDDDAGDRLTAAVRSSSIEVVVDDDDLPRSVEATIDFGTDVPLELVDALGPYATASIRLVVELEPLAGELTIEPPR